MSRKRTPLHQSINSLAASLPDIPSVGGHIVKPDDMIHEESETLVGDYCDHEPEIPVSAPSITVNSNIYVKPEGQSEDDVLATPQHIIGAPTTPHPKDSPWNALIPSPSPLDLFTTWSRTPEGHQARDSRIPTDPVRLGCILDDNARIAFMAGYAAATPSFE